MKVALTTSHQRRLFIHQNKNCEACSKFGALCFQHQEGEYRLLLVTTHKSKRWIIPKELPMNGRSPSEATADEAYQESSSLSRSFDRCLGHCSCTKGIKYKIDNMVAIVAAFPFLMMTLINFFLGRQDRTRKWFTIDKATERIQELVSREILSEFNIANFVENEIQLVNTGKL